MLRTQLSLLDQWMRSTIGKQACSMNSLYFFPLLSPHVPPSSMRSTSLLLLLLLLLPRGTHVLLARTDFHLRSTSDPMTACE